MANFRPHKRERHSRKPANGIASATRKTIWRGKTSIAISALSRSGVSTQNATVPTPMILPIQTARNHSLRKTDSSQKRTPIQKATKPTVTTMTFCNWDNDKSYPYFRSQYCPYFCMKYDVGQLMKFSCVIKAAPPIDTIHPITTAQINRAGVTASRFLNAACHDRCRKMRPTCSTARELKQANPNSSFISSATADHNPAQSRLSFVGLRTPRMAY